MQLTRSLRPFHPNTNKRSFALLLLLPLVLSIAFPADASPDNTEIPNTSLRPISANPLADGPIITQEQLGDLEMARRHYQAAIATYLKVSPKSALVWNKMGMANQQMYIIAEAKKDFEAALKLDPKSPDINNNLGTVYYSQKQFAIAEHYYRRAIKIEPRSAIIYKNLGTDLLAQDKYKKGWQCFQTAMSIDPNVFERENQYRIGEPTSTQKRGAMNYYLAKSYAHAGMANLAVEYLRRAIDEGFTDRKKIMADNEFASLHGVSAFEQLLASQRAQ